MTDPAPDRADPIVLRSGEARLLSAELRGDEPEWRRLRDGVRGAGGWAEVTPVVFGLAARRRFGEHPDLRAVALFVRRFLDRAPGTEAFSARDVEALIRGVTGEDHLVASVAPAAAGPIVYALVFALIDDLGLDDGQADALLAVAEQAVALARRDPAMPPGSVDAPGFDFGMHHRTRRPYLTDDDLRAEQTTVGGRRKDTTRKAARSASTIAGRYLRASMLRRGQEAARLMSILRPLANEDIARISRAAFEIAVPRYFPPGVDLREVAAVAAETRNAMTDDLDLMKTEFMIRQALGEQVVIQDIGTIEQLMIRMLTLAAFADFWSRDEGLVNAIIVEAEANLSAHPPALAIE